MTETSLGAPMPVIGPEWAALVRELEDLRLPDGTVAVLQWTTARAWI